MSKTKVRYGPSPTGIPQMGNIRTALLNYLFAKNQNGDFYLRIEDTDQARIVPLAVEKIKESLTSLNLNWDQEPIFQSKRLEIYKKHLEILKEKGIAYENEGAWRFKIPTGKRQISWQDAVHGKIEFPQDVLEDFVIVKSDGFPTYHFASVVDDHVMEISHVMRGDEWISSTPKHILLYEAFGWQHPIFVHLPPILGSNKKKLSKRDGAKSVIEFLNEGYLPEAIINFLAFLGWSPKGDQELYSLDGLVREFSLDRINKNSPIFNLDKLNWFNGQWIRKIDNEKLSKIICKRFPHLNPIKVQDVLPLVKDRLSTIDDFPKIAGFLIEEKIEINTDKIILPVDKLIAVKNKYENIKENEWVKVQIASATVSVMQEEGLDKPKLLSSIGIAVSGSSVTPPIYDSLEKLGRDRTIQRLEDAIREKSKK